MEAMRDPPEPAPRLGLEPAGVLERVSRLLLHVVARLDIDRAERPEVGLGHAPIVHRRAEEAGDTERLARRGHLFEMPPQRLLTLVDAAADLKGRRAVRSPGVAIRDPAGMDHQGVERLVAVVPLEGMMVDPPPFETSKRLDLLNQPRPLGLREPPQVNW